MSQQLRTPSVLTEDLHGAATTPVPVYNASSFVPAGSWMQVVHICARKWLIHIKICKLITEIKWILLLCSKMMQNCEQPGPVDTAKDAFVPVAEFIWPRALFNWLLLCRSLLKRARVEKAKIYFENIYK